VAQRRHHYEAAFEGYLRSCRIPYVAVNEARKALLPDPGHASPTDPALKSFDFVLYGQSSNLLIEIKGRRAAAAPGRRPRLECWTTQDDVDSLRAWERLFGSGFAAAFLFIYWCEAMPPAALFEEMMEHQDRWYAMRLVTVEAYAAHMRPRSPRWRTVHLPTSAYDRLSSPLSAALGRSRALAGA
jgi:hypothetical protein